MAKKKAITPDTKEIEFTSVERLKHSCWKGKKDGCHTRKLLIS